MVTRPTELETAMDMTLGGFAFAGFIAAQFLAVIAVCRERLRDGEQPSSIAFRRKLKSTASSTL